MIVFEQKLMFLTHNMNYILIISSNCRTPRAAKSPRTPHTARTPRTPHTTPHTEKTWTHEKEELLCELWFAAPFMYNKRDGNYKNNTKRHYTKVKWAAQLDVSSKLN